MTRALRHGELTPQTDLPALIRETGNDRTPRLIEEDGRAVAMLAPVEDYVREHAEDADLAAVRDILSFYAEMNQRPDVRELLSRLA